MPFETDGSRSEPDYDIREIARWSARNANRFQL